MPMEQSPQPVAASSGSAPPKSGIKLVLKVGGSTASTGGVSPASSGSSITQNAPVVAYSSTVPAPTPLYSGGYPPTGGKHFLVLTFYMYYYCYCLLRIKMPILLDKNSNCFERV